MSSRGGGRKKRCSTCLNILDISRFTSNPGPGYEFGVNRICLDCLDATTNVGHRKGHRKRKTWTDLSANVRRHHELFVYLFEGGWTFPRAEAFRPGMTLREVFDQQSLVKIRTRLKRRGE